jgi:3-deoxy-D-manno-octulosonic acid kinase
LDDGLRRQEHLTPFRDARGYGAILFDRTQLRQPDPAWFAPQHWGDAAQPVSGGGRGGAWFIQTGEGDAVLRQYLRGGWMASLSRDGHLWRGINRVRSFAEFRLMRVLREKNFRCRHSLRTTAARHAIPRCDLMQRCLALFAGRGCRCDAPWEAAGS